MNETCCFWVKTYSQKSHNPQEKYSYPIRSQRTSLRVLRVATIVHWGTLFLVRGNLELANVPNNPFYHHIDVAYYGSMYY